MYYRKQLVYQCIDQFFAFLLIKIAFFAYKNDNFVLTARLETKKETKRVTNILVDYKITASFLFFSL